MPHISWPMRHRLPPGCAATFRPVCRSWPLPAMAS